MKISLKTWLAMWVLSFSCFVIVTTELAPIGLISSLAQDLGQSEAQIGLIVTGYGGLAAIAALLAKLLFSRISKKLLLIVLMLILAASNFLVALSDAFVGVFWARALGAISHGAFWALIGGVTYSLVPKEKLGLASSVIFSGVSIASALGIPLASFLNQVSDWRVVFSVIGLLALISCVMIALCVPPIPNHPATNQGRVFAPLKNKKLNYGFALTTVVIVAHFAAFTFIEPFLLQVIHLETDKIALYLLCFGLSGFTGNIIAGKLMDRYLKPLLSIAIVSIALSLCGLAFLPAHDGWSVIIFLSLWKAAIAILFVGLQTWVLQTAKEQASAASAIYVAIFNASIGLGAAVGGVLIQGFSYALTFGVLALILLLSLGLVRIISAKTTTS